MSALLTILALFVILGAVIVGIDRLARRLRSERQAHQHVRGAQVVAATGARADGLQIMIGPVAIPPLAETTHTMIAGARGSGKSLAINRMFATVVERGQPAVCVDPGGGLLERFYNPARDVILNPLDSRAHAWDVFDEIEGPWDCPRLAASLCPAGGSDSSKEWSGYSQSLLTALIGRMSSHDMQEFVRLAVAADVQELAPLLAGKAASALISPGAVKMLGSVRAILGSRLGVWEFMPTGRETFSFRTWLQAPRGVVWLPSRADQRALLAPLYGSMCGAFSTGLLSCSEDLSRRVWLFLDEAPSLGPIEGLERLLAEGRKFGAGCVLGFQDVSQIRSAYGRETAQTLASVMRTKLVMAAEDPESADYYSKMLGQREIIRPQKSVNDSGVSVTYQHTTESVVLPSELLGLGVGVGYLKVAGDATIKKVRVPIPDLPPKLHPAFQR